MMPESVRHIRSGTRHVSIRVGETLGASHEGDLRSNRGSIITGNQEITSAFAPLPPAPHADLDTARALDGGDLLFSRGVIRADFRWPGSKTRRPNTGRGARHWTQTLRFSSNRLSRLTRAVA